jgi:UDP-N-acetylmuramate--alanine ligase
VRAAGIEVVVSTEPELRDGWEVVVSSAYPTVAGRSRAEFLAELVSLRRSVVVGGTHGKSTTAALIAFALLELGRDPAFLIGAEVPQLGGNAGTGEGWLVVEGDESDRTIELLRPEIGVVTNVELDHHVTFASEADLAELFARWLADVPHPVRGWELEPLAPDALPHLPGEHNRRNGAAALAALELAGEEREAAARAIREFRGAARRFQLAGEVRGVAVYDDYAHHPTELAATIAAARERGERVHVLFQPHLPSRTRHLAHELGAALAEADSACVTEIYAAREEVPPALSGKAVVDGAAEARPGMPVGWAPEIADGARIVAGWADPGDLVLVVGAGDVDRAVPLVLEALR